MKKIHKIEIEWLDSTQQREVWHDIDEVLTEYKGIGWGKDTCRWRAYITKNNKYIHLGHFQIGHFQNIQDALIARIQAEKKYFGEFSRKSTTSMDNTNIL